MYTGYISLVCIKTLKNSVVDTQALYMYSKQLCIISTVESKMEK